MRFLREVRQGSGPAPTGFPIRSRRGILPRILVGYLRRLSRTFYGERRGLPIYPHLHVSAIEDSHARPLQNVAEGRRYASRQHCYAEDPHYPGLHSARPRQRVRIGRSRGTPHAYGHRPPCPGSPPTTGSRNGRDYPSGSQQTARPLLERAH